MWTQSKLKLNHSNKLFPTLFSFTWLKNVRKYKNTSIVILFLVFFLYNPCSASSCRKKIFTLVVVNYPSCLFCLSILFISTYTFLGRYFASLFFHIPFHVPSSLSSITASGQSGGDLHRRVHCCVHFRLRIPRTIFFVLTETGSSGSGVWRDLHGRGDSFPLLF